MPNNIYVYCKSGVGTSTGNKIKNQKIKCSGIITESEPGMKVIYPAPGTELFF
jgi:hypothetical protein